MGLRASFIVPARDKEAHIGECVRSVLAQTYSPMEIVFSDQGSRDGTLAVIRDLVGGYDGPNEVRVLECPDTDYRGMMGLNAHLNWLDTQIQGDVVIMCSADDYVLPRRAEVTVRAFEEHNPSYVNTIMKFVGLDGNSTFTRLPDQTSRFLRPEETIRHQIGSCGSSAWARDLYQKHGPLVGCEQQDMVLPMMALFERGIYFVDEPEHVYVERADPNNTGFQGQIKAAQGDDLARVVELNNFMHVANWTSILRRWQAAREPLARLSEDTGAYDAFMEKLCGTANAWASVREAMVASRIQPMAMRV